jgi:hypothetical protein
MYVLRWQWVQSLWNEYRPLHMLARVRYTPESPPDVAFQRDTIFMSLIIPGHSRSNMGVYMEPLWDELISAWEVGVWTYD